MEKKVIFEKNLTFSLIFLTAWLEFIINTFQSFLYHSKWDLLSAVITFSCNFMCIIKMLYYKSLVKKRTSIWVDQLSFKRVSAKFIWLPSSLKEDNGLLSRQWSCFFQLSIIVTVFMRSIMSILIISYKFWTHCFVSFLRDYFFI